MAKLKAKKKSVKKKNKPGYYKWSLDDWVKIFDGIYGHKNLGLDVQIWSHVIEELGELAEDLRKGQLNKKINAKGESEGITVNVPDVFAWLCAFAKRHGGSLLEIVWHKFPGVCPYCFKPKDCICLSGGMAKMSPKQRNEKLELYRDNKNEKKKYKTLWDWQKMFFTIYGGVNRVQSVEGVGFHLIEEAAEVAKEIRKNESEFDLRDEVADVFAWLNGVCIRYGTFVEKDMIRLDEYTWKRYPRRCPHCETKRCRDDCRISDRIISRHEVS